MDKLMIAIHHPMFVIPLVCGFVVDLVLGDPLWLPHPIRWFGAAIAYCEQRMNREPRRTSKGILLVLLLLAATWCFLAGLLYVLLPYPYLYYPVASLLVFYGLANNSLIAEARRVNRALTHNGIEAGRRQLSFIVGRDTSALAANQVRIATLETLSENLSDGIVAPLCFYALGGAPLMLAYKMANTLDSMIGYKNERFKRFGMFAARTDDVLNFIPARITALLMILISGSTRALTFVFRYGHKHSSPNSGYPEAALAGILNCRFGGPNTYHSTVVNKPFIGHNDRVITNGDMRKAYCINIGVSVLLVLLLVWIF